MFRTYCSWLSLVGLASLLGCGVGHGNLPDLIDVKGKITVDGKQMPGLRVVFEPESGRRSVGFTNESGDFSLNYLPSVAGAIPGKHRVKISWEGDGGDVGSSPPSAAILIPSRYNIRSELVAIVSQDKRQFDFDLSTKRR